MSDSLRPDGLQHARPPYRNSWVYSNSCPLSRWCHPTISSSVVPFSSRLQSFPASGSFPMSQLFASGCQNIGVSASLKLHISPTNEHPGLISFRMDWLDLLAVQGTLKSLLQNHSSKASVLLCSAFFIVQLSHPYMTTGSLRHPVTPKELWISLSLITSYACSLLSVTFPHEPSGTPFHDKVSPAHSHVTMGLPFTSSG